MLKELLIPALLVTATPTDQISPRYYIDYQDTTSFSDAWELTHEDEYSLSYAEVYGVEDTYDYVKYTAPYTRCVLLTVSTNSTCIITVDVFVPSKSQTIPFATYNSTNFYDSANSVPIEQGDTVFFRIESTGNCWWEATLETVPVTLGGAYTSYEKFFNYDMPYTQGGVVIKYKYDDSCYATVPGQNYTFRDVFIDATEVWEGVGQIDLVESSTNAWFTVSVTDVEALEVYRERSLLVNNYYTSEVNFPSFMGYYNVMTDGSSSWYGAPVTTYDAILGVGVHAFGLALGLANWNDSEYSGTNMMAYAEKPYFGLGDGDIYSFIQLWGDANGEIY